LPRRACLSILAALLLGLAAGAAPAAEPDDPAPASEEAPDLTADEVRHHLGHVIDWYHRLAALEPNAALTDDVLTRERLNELRLLEVRLAFAFGRAAAPLILEEEAEPEGAEDAARAGEGLRYERMVARMDDRESELRAQIAALDARMADAPATERRVLAAQREQLQAAIAFTGEVQSTVQRLQQFAARSNSSASGQTGLLADITDMERTVPEARMTGRGQAADDAAPATAPGPRPAASGRDDAGILALISEWLALRTAIRQHAHYIDATAELSEALSSLSSGLAAEVRELVRTATTAADGSDAEEIAAARSAIRRATVRFRELSTLLIPLGEESITIDSAGEVLEQRRAALRARENAVARQLAVRSGLLIASIGVILAISALWRRATFRYLHDARRRRQFLTLRRVLTTLALIVVVFMAFLSEVGSIATYIGFLTAGLAVALQNVILAVVAYFFLIGRYGVRVGDRVTMANVTGRVAEIGLVRTYLTELAGPDLNPTGRMIVLSNAVVFQPTALFKQLPGVEYTWHTVSFVLDPGADPVLARARLQQRADEVYATYQASIERQLRAARDRVDFESVNPSPEVTARFSEAGLEVAVRYPVEPQQAAVVDQHMSRALREALDEEPALRLAASVSTAAQSG
jgi:small-conductance mechanosensitive channel